MELLFSVLEAIWLLFPDSLVEATYNIISVFKKAAVIDDGIFYGANVDKIFNKEQWDEKISEAKKDGKMVSSLITHNHPGAYIVYLDQCYCVIIVFVPR